MPAMPPRRADTPHGGPHGLGPLQLPHQPLREQGLPAKTDAVFNSKGAPQGVGGRRDQKGNHQKYYEAFLGTSAMGTKGVGWPSTVRAPWLVCLPHPLRTPPPIFTPTPFRQGWGLSVSPPPPPLFLLLFGRLV